MTQEATGCDCEFGQYNRSEDLFGDCSKEELIQQIQQLTSTVNSLLDEKQILQYQLEFQKYIIINCSDNSNETHRLTEVESVTDSEDNGCGKDLPNNDSILQELRTDPFPSNVIYDDDDDRENNCANGGAGIDENLLPASDGLEESLQFEDLVETDWISKVTVSEADKGDINLNVLAKLNQEIIPYEVVPSICKEEVVITQDEVTPEIPTQPAANNQPKGKSTTDFCCHLCPSTYKYHFSLKRHLLQQHNICTIISSRKLSKKNVELEKQNHVISSGVSCKSESIESCTSSGEIKSEEGHENLVPAGSEILKKKAKKQKKVLNLVCELCGQSFKYLYNYQRHMKKLHCENEEKFPCSICAKVFPSHKSLRRHQNDVHYTSPEDKHFQCNLCLELFKYHYLLRRHTARVHEFKNRVSCSLCSKTFATEYHLRRHLALHEKNGINANGPQKLQSESDTSSSSSGIGIRKRPRSHGDSFVCEYCGKVFPKKNRLVQHCVSHAEEKPFSCQLCEKSFTRKAKLIQHQMKRHFNELGGDAFGKLNGKIETKEMSKIDVASG